MKNIKKTQSINYKGVAEKQGIIEKQLKRNIKVSRNKY